MHHMFHQLNLSAEISVNLISILNPTRKMEMQMVKGGLCFRSVERKSTSPVSYVDLFPDF